MSSHAYATGIQAAHAVFPRTNNLCSIDDDVKLLIADKLHSFDDYDNVMGIDSSWHELLGQHQNLITRGIVVSMT